METVILAFPDLRLLRAQTRTNESRRKRLGWCGHDQEEENDTRNGEDGNADNDRDPTKYSKGHRSSSSLRARQNDEETTAEEERRKRRRGM